mmetsp:Transcript_99640/g.181767  ORF Transcript_99640/g.181767 Transcript_99640/m.181767 type:complete len:195 (+) Transcript_99640:150-734(+)
MDYYYYNDPILTEIDSSLIGPVALHPCLDPMWSQKMTRISQRHKFIQRQQKKLGLSEQRLREHDRYHDSGLAVDTSPHLECLISVKSKSDEVRAQTFNAMAGRILSSLSCPNIASHVAEFAGGDCMSDRDQASLDEEEVPDGHHVRGCKVFRRPVMFGEGRPGFRIDLDAEIATPRGSQASTDSRDWDSQSEWY